MLKTDDQIKRMRETGLLLWETHSVASRLIMAGITTKQINAEIEHYILKHNAIPLFKGVPGKTPYPAGSCISVNDEVVHGIPSDKTLNNGDIVGIDIGVKLNGWCADAAVTYPVGNVSDRVKALLSVTENALRESIQLLGKKSKWSLIVKKTSERVIGAGFSIVEELVGHGIGREMWEAPQIPNYYSERNSDFRIRPGLVIAVEPMINAGTKEVATQEDHWTIVTKDGQPSAHFEHTIAITEHGPVVLTCGPNGEGWGMPQ
jgi:methionyl aminopeptidase